jgi:hypothetical protein
MRKLITKGFPRMKATQENVVASIGMIEIISHYIMFIMASPTCPHNQSLDNIHLHHQRSNQV